MLTHIKASKCPMLKCFTLDKLSNLENILSISTQLVISRIPTFAHVQFIIHSIVPLRSMEFTDFQPKITQPTISRAVFEISGPEEFSAQADPARENFEIESARPGRILNSSRLGPARPEETFSKSYIIVQFPRLIRDFLNQLWRFKANFDLLP